MCWRWLGGVWRCGEKEGFGVSKSMLHVLSRALSLPARPFVCRSLSLAVSPLSPLLAWCRPFRACVRVTSVFVRVKPRPLTCLLWVVSRASCCPVALWVPPALRHLHRRRPLRAVPYELCCLNRINHTKKLSAIQRLDNLKTKTHWIRRKPSCSRGGALSRHHMMIHHHHLR